MITRIYNTDTSKSQFGRGGAYDADIFCESTDTKPVDVEPNTICLELDTKVMFYFTGTEWKEVGWNA